MPKPTDRMSGTKSRLAQLRGASTEEELLAYQQEFLKSQERPAASVVRASRTAPATGLNFQLTFFHLFLLADFDCSHRSVGAEQRSRDSGQHCRR
jgi:hypothetical protein